MYTAGRLVVRELPRCQPERLVPRRGAQVRHTIIPHAQPIMEIPAVRRTQPITVGRNFFNNPVQLLQWLHCKQKRHKG